MSNTRTHIVRQPVLVDLVLLKKAVDMINDKIEHLPYKVYINLLL